MSVFLTLPSPTTCPPTKLELEFSGLRALVWVWFCPNVRTWTRLLLGGLQQYPFLHTGPSYICAHLSEKRSEWCTLCHFPEKLKHIYLTRAPNLKPTQRMSLGVILKQSISSSFGLCLYPKHQDNLVCDRVSGPDVCPPSLEHTVHQCYSSPLTSRTNSKGYTHMNT